MTVVSTARVRKITLALCFFGIAGCLILLITPARNAVIQAGERFVANSPYAWQLWHDNDRYVHTAVIALTAFVLVSVLSICGGVGGGMIYKKPLAAIENHPVLYYAFLLLPALYGFAAVLFFGVNFIQGDEWELVSFFRNASKDGLTFSALFAQHNEHRIFFPRIIFYILGTLTKLNTKSFMYVSFIFNVMRYCVFVIFIKQITKNKKCRICLNLLIGLLVFSTVQYENLFWGFQLGWFMLASLAVLSFYLFYLAYTKNRCLYYALADVSAIIASFSSIHGLLVLPAALCVFVLLSVTTKKPAVKPLLFIIVPLIFSFIAYFINYSTPARHYAYFGNISIKSLIYFFISLGSGVTQPLPVGLILLPVNAALLFAGVWFIVRLIKTKNIKDNIFPLCLLFFGYAFCAAITIGRGGNSFFQGLESRYTTFSLFVVIALLLLTVAVFDIKIENWAGYALKAAFVIVMIQNVFFTDMAAINKKGNGGMLLDYKNQPMESIRNIYPFQSTQDIYDNIQFLEQKGWSVFNLQKKDEH